ncbi:MAG TPA: hypothetical protein PKE04_16320 [Clostridia bacterium]|nr:hypothetical protein [Clostridia bacterium]
MTCVDAFYAAPRPDPWGRLRVPFSPVLARMGAEFSAASYGLSIGPFLRAGWTDVNFLLDNRAFSLGEALGERKWQHHLEREWKLLRAQQWLRLPQPVGDVIRVRQQPQRPEAGKTVLMARTLDQKRAIIAITFIGTTQRLYDWFSNFKLHVEEGMHQGFLSLARHFLTYADRFSFPETAMNLGMERLTLADAFAEAARPDSRILLFLTGHSQGGAVVQTAVHRMRAMGVLDSNLLAYTYAAPKAAALGGVADPANYPIHNLVNSDDFVPILGAQLRLGLDWIYEPSEAFRALCYDWPPPNQSAVMDATRALFANAPNSETVMAYLIALLRLLEGMPDRSQALALLRRTIDRYPFFRQVTQFAESYLERGLSRSLRWLEGAYLQFAGQAPDGESIARMQADWLAFYRQAGSLDIALDGLRTVLFGPHMICVGRGVATPPYLCMVRSCLPDLSCGVWQPDAPARCVDPNGAVLLGSPRS